MFKTESDEKVDFFIVGAMKSGTSSLKSMLSKHPEIDMLPNEAHYFSNDENYSKGEQWYHSLFKRSKGSCKRGEKSPPYSVTINSAERIHSYNPDAKIIWLFRNPIKRAISHYYHAKTKKDSAMSITEAIEKSGRLQRKRSPQAYIYRSEYMKQIKEFRKYFPKKNMKVLIFEELLKDPDSVMKDLYRFLGVDSKYKFKLPHRNVTNKDIVKKYRISDDELEILSNKLIKVKPSIEKYLGREIEDW